MGAKEHKMLAIKSLLVFADKAADAVARLDAAAGMAERWDAHLTAVALTAHPSFHAGYQGVASSQAYFDELERAHTDAAALADRCAKRFATLGMSGDARWGSDTISGLAEIAAIHAYYADLSILAQPGDDECHALRHAVIEGVLFDSGRPSLLLPRNWSGGEIGRRVLIAWRPSPEAARAVHDATSFIRSADAVTIVVVDPEIGEREHGEEPGASIAATLVRHGVDVTVDTLPTSGRSVAEQLRFHAVDCSADLIVMGGYSHSVLRESLVGGATREMISETETPLLISH